MKAREARHIENTIAYNLHSLKLLKCQFRQEIIEDLPTNCVELNQLSRMLTLKNNQMRFLKNKSKRKQPSPTEQTQSPSNLKILLELQSIKELLKQQPGKDSKQQRKFNAIVSNHIRLNTSHLPQQRNNNIVYHFQMLGGKEAFEIAKMIGIEDECNAEDVEELVECVNQILSLDQPISLAKDNKTSSKINLHKINQYRPLLDEIITCRSQDNNNNYLIQLATSNMHEQSCLQKMGRSHHLFHFLLHQLMNHIRAPKHDNHRYVLAEYDRLEKNIEYFSKDQAKQKKFQGELTQTDLWQKICYLFRKGTPFNTIILMHFQQYRQFELIHFFNAVLAGRQHQFQKDAQTFTHNSHYRELILLLERKCLQNRLEKYPSLPVTKDLVGIALKEISLKHLFREDISLHINFIEKYCYTKLQNLQSLISQSSHQINKQGIIQLFSLGQFAKTLEMLYNYDKIDPIQFLILLSILCQVDHRYSHHLFYSHDLTIHAYVKLLKQILQTATKGEQFFPQLNMAFLPILGINLNDENATTIDIITVSRPLFEQLMHKRGYLNFSKQLGLTLRDLPNILAQSIRKHSNYAFCLQLCLSASLHIDGLYLIDNLLESKVTQNNLRYSRTRSRGNRRQRKYNSRQFEIDQMDLLKGLSRQDRQDLHEERLAVLFEGCQLLVRSNIALLKDADSIQKYYEELSFVNSLYLKLKQANVRSLISANLLDRQTTEAKIKIQDNIQLHLETILLSHDLVTLKIGIESKQFELIVQCLNHFLEEICTGFKKIQANLSDIFTPSESIHYVMFYFTSIVQSAIFFKECKPKKYRQNRSFILGICNQILNLLEKMPQASSAKQLKIAAQSLLKQIHT